MAQDRTLSGMLEEVSRTALEDNLSGTDWLGGGTLVRDSTESNLTVLKGDVITKQDMIVDAR